MNLTLLFAASVGEGLQVIFVECCGPWCSRLTLCSLYQQNHHARVSTRDVSPISADEMNWNGHDMHSLLGSSTKSRVRERWATQQYEQREFVLSDATSHRRLLNCIELRYVSKSEGGQECRIIDVWLDAHHALERPEGCREGPTDGLGQLSAGRISHESAAANRSRWRM